MLKAKVKMLSLKNIYKNIDKYWTYKDGSTFVAKNIIILEYTGSLLWLLVMHQNIAKCISLFSCLDERMMHSQHTVRWQEFNPVLIKFLKISIQFQPECALLIRIL